MVPFEPALSPAFLRHYHHEFVISQDGQTGSVQPGACPLLTKHTAHAAAAVVLLVAPTMRRATALRMATDDGIWVGGFNAPQAPRTRCAALRCVLSALNDVVRPASDGDRGGCLPGGATPDLRKPPRTDPWSARCSPPIPRHKEQQRHADYAEEHQDDVDVSQCVLTVVDCARLAARSS